MEIVINDSLRKIQELDLKKKREEEAEIVKQTVSILAERLNESLKNKDYISVDILVQEILTKDPENLLALEAKDIIAEFKEQEREKAEKLELAEKERKYLLDKMAPGRNYMSQGNYYKAIMFFEDFLLKPISVEDIRVEVSGLLDESKEKLYAITMPLIQEADLAFENKQFKKSYETYEKILEKDPSLVDIIIKLGQLKSFIDHRIKDRYQKAILSESYGYLEESKQYFSEILDTTPEKHIFYKKSEQKLLSYIND
jgi:tetratricopeptide (TPR) repeat protein